MDFDKTCICGVGEEEITDAWASEDLRSSGGRKGK